MQIKNLLILLAVLLIQEANCFAQSSTLQIEGFWGVKLGEPQNTVISKVRQSYPSADYAKDIKSHPFQATKVKLAGLDADKCEFTFTNGVFTSAKFSKCAGSKFVFNVDSYLSRIAPQAQSDYQEFCEAISEKYGTPKVSGQTVTWRTSNGNSITIKPWTNTPGDIMDNGTTFAAMGIYIIYTKGSHLNDF